MNLENKSIETIFTSGTDLRFQEISFDKKNNKIFMTTYHDNGQKTISVYDLSSKSFFEVINSTQWFDSYPSISPDGKYLAFYSQRSGQNEIWVLNLENLKYHQLTGEADIYFNDKIVWSKSGKRLHVIGNSGKGKALYSFSFNL